MSWVRLPALRITRYCKEFSVHWSSRRPLAWYTMCEGAVNVLHFTGADSVISGAYSLYIVFDAFFEYSTVLIASTVNRLTLTIWIFRLPSVCCTCQFSSGYHASLIHYILLQMLGPGLSSVVIIPPILWIYPLQMASISCPQAL